MLTGPVQSHFAELKGIDPQYEMKVSDMLQHLKAGNIAGLNRQACPGSSWDRGWRKIPDDAGRQCHG